ALTAGAAGTFGGTATGGVSSGGSGGMCAPGFGNCDASSDGSCEQDLTGSDARYCGSCTVSCGNCTNDCTAATSEPPVCGTENSTAAPHCYKGRIYTSGFNVDSTFEQGRAAQRLHVIRYVINPENKDPFVFSMGIYEANGNIPYYLALYKAGGTNGYAAERVWASAIQTSRAHASHYRNEIAVTPPIRLERGAAYWAAVLVYDDSGSIQSLMVATQGPDSANRGVEQFAYSGYTTPPASLLNIDPAADEAALEVPGLFVRTAAP
ncbi:MAG TPA: hypothetical protein VIV60_34840, partial [Polyangiaceae bacterium]